MAYSIKALEFTINTDMRVAWWTGISPSHGRPIKVGRDLAFVVTASRPSCYKRFLYQNNTVQYITVQYITVQYSTVQTAPVNHTTHNSDTPLARGHPEHRAMLLSSHLQPLLVNHCSPNHKTAGTFNLSLYTPQSTRENVLRGIFRKAKMYM